MSGDKDLRLPLDLVEAMSGVRSLAVLTGAGMSAESGVPVFRGQGGLWEGFRPEDLATPEGFARNPERVWRWYRWRLERVTEAQPHAGHRALARLEQSGRLETFTIVTQNVDSMHQRAGNTRVVELHGNLTRARCEAGCGRVIPSASVDPAHSLCRCGRGHMRPDVVWFGESLPEAAMVAASGMLSRADMVWVVGTSAMVYPAAVLPEIAAERGVPVVEINPERTPLSGRLRYSLRETAARGLTALVEAFGV